MVVPIVSQRHGCLPNELRSIHLQASRVERKGLLYLDPVATYGQALKRDEYGIKRRFLKSGQVAPRVKDDNAKKRVREGDNPVPVSSSP